MSDDGMAGGTDGQPPAGPPWPLPAELDVPANARLASLLRRTPLHAHSDIAASLAIAEKRFAPRNVGRYLPSKAGFSYELRYAPNGCVFCLVYGQHGIALRLAAADRARVLADGAIADEHLGDGWFTFTNPRHDLLEKWYLRALDLAGQRSLQVIAERIDMNAALETYSHSMGNDRGALDKYVANLRLPFDAGDIADEIDGLQGRFYDIVLATAGARGFRADELERFIEQAANDDLRWLDGQGRHALLRWLVWMCWHEGYLDQSGDDERIDDAAIALTDGASTAPAHPPLLAALDWLLQAPADDQPFVIVSGADDGDPLVQYAGGAGDALLADIPFAPLDSMARDRLVAVLRKAGVTLETDAPSCVLWFGRDAARAARFAGRILTDLFGIAPERFRIARSDQNAAPRRGDLE